MKLTKLIFSAIILSVSFAQTAISQTDIYIRGSGRLFPIALPQLCLRSGDTTADKEIPKIITRDLDLSGYFEVLDPGGYVESPGKCATADGFAYSDWSVIGAEGLVRGEVSRTSSGVKIQLFLHDVQGRKVVLGKEYEGDEYQTPKIAHKFANEIMKFFTGEAGVFGTQISYSSRVGRFKELFVMDMDGSNVRQLTEDKSLAVSASWDRAGRSLVYTSYRKRMPDLFTIDVQSKRSRQLTSGPSLDLGARFAHLSRRIIASVTESRDSDLVLMDEDGQITKRLTPPNGAIDVSPDWSPDDSQVVFCSNRSGGPQIYVMGSDGSSPHRISFVNSNYCTSPRWSPKGDKLAFVCRADAGFNIFVAGADGSNPLQLTSVGSNEDPDWSPDGRYLTFATTFGHPGTFSIAIMRADGAHMREVSSSRGGDYQPSWGPLGQ